MIFIISYDITNDRKRARVAKKLEGVGVRLQYSLFECDLNSRELKLIRKQIDSMINPRSDSVLYIPVCGKCNAGRSFSGLEKVVVRTEVVVA